MVKERPDLMRPDICSVWLEVGYKHQKKILLCNVYREWQELGADNTGNITEQLLRWTKFLDIWEIALASGLETICTGDININHCNWKDQNIWNIGVSKTRGHIQIKMPNSSQEPLAPHDP